MNIVSFYEISPGHPPDNYVRVGTGTVEEVRGMERPACYLCLHGSVDVDQPTGWAHLGVAVLDEASHAFKDVEQEGLEQNGAPISLAFHGTPLINRALPVVRAFTDDATPTPAESARWFAIEASNDHVVPWPNKRRGLGLPAQAQRSGGKGRATSASTVRETILFLSLTGL